MKRKLVYAGTAWAAGLILAACVNSVYISLIIVIAAALVFKILFDFDWKSVLFMMIMITAAFGYYMAYDIFVYEKIADFNGENISYTGKITDFKDYSDNNSVYYLNGKINGKTNAKIILYTDSIMCDPGDSLCFNCKAELPKSSYLFNGFEYYKSKGIYLRTYSANDITVRHPEFSLTGILYRFREKVKSVVTSSVPKDEAGMIIAMLFGDKSGINEDDMTMMYRTGIGHITAVSGLHLVLFCSLISFILKKLKSGVILQFIISEIFMILFAICCGMSVSVIRALIMMTLINLAPLFFRYTDTLNSICIAVMLLTLHNPFIISNSSFLLSVSGALGAGVFAPYMTENIKSDTKLWKLLKNICFLTCISLAVIPASLICFGELSLISPISNLIITPACMAAILVAIIASLLIFLKPVFLFKISGIICRAVLNISRITGSNNFTHAKLTGDYVAVIIIIIVLFCISTQLIFKNEFYNFTAVLLSIAMLFSSSLIYSFFNRNVLKLAMLGNNNIGVVIITKGKSADIIDLNGNTKNSRYAAKYLDNMGISEINNIIITEKAYSTISSYNYDLSLCSAENVILPDDTLIMKNIRICGCIPRYSDFENLSVSYGDYTINFINDTVYVNFGKIHFKYPNSYNDILKCKPNTVLHFSDDGKYSLRRLENG